MFSWLQFGFLVISDKSYSMAQFVEEETDWFLLGILASLFAIGSLVCIYIPESLRACRDRLARVFRRRIRDGSSQVNLLEIQRDGHVVIENHWIEEAQQPETQKEKTSSPAYQILENESTDQSESTDGEKTVDEGAPLIKDDKEKK